MWRRLAWIGQRCPCKHNPQPNARGFTSHLRRNRTKAQISSRPKPGTMCWTEFSNRLGHDAVSHSSLETLPALVVLPRVTEALQAVIPRLGSDRSAIRRAYNRVIRKLVDAGKVSEASSLASKLPSPDSLTLYMICTSWMRIGRPHSAIAFAKTLMDRGAELKQKTITILLRACGLVCDFDFAESLNSCIKDKGIKRDAHLFAAQITACSSAIEAECVLNQASELGLAPSSHLTVALLSVYARELKIGRLEKSIAARQSHLLLAQLSSAGVVPNVHVLNKMLYVLGLAGRGDDALALLTKLTTSVSVSPNLLTYSTLLDMLGREGRFRDWFRLFRRMRHDGLPINGIIMSSLARHLRQHDVGETGRACLMVFRMGQDTAKAPERDRLLFSTIVQELFRDSLHSHAGSCLNRAMSFLSHIQAHNKWNVDSQTYSQIIRALAKRGLLSQCIEFFSKESAAFGVNPVSLMNVLAAVKSTISLRESLQIFDIVQKSGSVFSTISAFPYLISCPDEHLDRFLTLLRERSPHRKGAFVSFLRELERPIEMESFLSCRDRFPDDGLGIALILSRFGRLDECAEILKRWKAKPRTPDFFKGIQTKALYMIAISAADNDYISLCERLHRSIISSSYGEIERCPLALSLLEKRIGMYLRCERAREANRIRLDNLHHAQRIPMSAYTTLVSMLGRQGFANDCLNVLGDMRGAGITPSLRNFNDCLESLAAHGRVQDCQELLTRIRDSGSRPNLFSFNALLKSFVFSNDLPGALSVIEMLKDHDISPDIYTFNMLSSIAAGTAGIEECDNIVALINQFNVHPDACTFSWLLRVSSKKFQRERCERIIREALDAGVEPIQFILLVFMAYFRDFEMAQARFVLSLTSDLPASSQPLWSRLRWRMAFSNPTIDWRRMFSLLRQVGAQVSIRYFNEAMSIYIRRRDVQGMEAMYSLIGRVSSVRPNPRTYALALVGYGRGGYVDRCFELWNRASAEDVAPNVYMYTAMIDAMSRNDRIEESQRLWKSMRSEGIVPTIVSYTSMMFTYARLGRLAACRVLLEEVDQKGIVPDFIMVKALIEAAGRYGNVKLADALFEVVDEMCIVTDVSMFDALIKTHMRHNNLRRCREIQREMQRRDLKSELFDQFQDEAGLPRCNSRSSLEIENLSNLDNHSNSSYL